MSARKGNKRTDKAKIVMKTVASMKEEIKRLSGVNKEMLEALEVTHTQIVGGLDVYLRYEASHPLVGLALQIEELLRKAKGEK